MLSQEGGPMAQLIEMGTSRPLGAKSGLYILRMCHLVRDEWVNIGVLDQSTAGDALAA